MAEGPLGAPRPLGIGPLTKNRSVRTQRGPPEVQQVLELIREGDAWEIAEDVPNDLAILLDVPTEAVIEVQKARRVYNQDIRDQANVGRAVEDINRAIDDIEQIYEEAEAVGAPVELFDGEDVTQMEDEMLQIANLMQKGVDPDDMHRVTASFTRKWLNYSRWMYEQAQA